MARDDTTPCWFHVILTTYGAWLPGDPRGFRTRHHRDHVEGDYKKPPEPGIYEGFARANRESLKQDAISLDRGQRRLLGLALKSRLDELNTSLIAVAVSSQHIHLLFKLAPKTVRIQVGVAKKHACSRCGRRGGSRSFGPNAASFCAFATVSTS